MIYKLQSLKVRSFGEFPILLLLIRELQSTIFMSLVAKWLMHWTVDLEVTGSIAPGIILSPSVALGGDIIITLSCQSWGTSCGYSNSPSAL